MCRFRDADERERRVSSFVYSWAGSLFLFHAKNWIFFFFLFLEIKFYFLKSIDQSFGCRNFISMYWVLMSNHADVTMSVSRHFPSFREMPTTGKKKKKTTIFSLPISVIDL